MAEDDDKDDKTEAPTGGRLDKAYKEGNVALSRDVASLGSLAAAAITLVVVGKALGDSLVHMFTVGLGRLDSANPQELFALAAKPALLTLGIAAAAAAGAILATGTQTRFGFWSDRILPDLTKVFSGARLLHMVDKDQALDLLASLVKSVAVGWVLWSGLRAEIMTLPKMFQLGPAALLTAMYGPIANILVKLLATLVILAGADFALTRYRYIKQLKMSKEEIKREAKDDEGDPAMKGRRRAKHRQIMKNRIAFEVPRADVVIVNPTHIAIVLRYRSDEDAAPRVTAKGKGEHAEKIRELARENGIPIVENIPLARLLFRRVKVGRAVPAETFKAVAAILAFVYRTLGRNQQGGQEVSL
ncbi:MAG TPA: EscU/YscU/HrcU family type III secretion system export apparatus switch protein [Polyangia bacterium]